MYNRVPSSDFVKFLKSEGYDNSEAFEKFLSENLLTKSDSLNYLESEKTDQIIFGVIIESNHIKEKMIDSDEHMKFFAQVLAILFSIAYPIRFFALGVKWSLGIINQKILIFKSILSVSLLPRASTSRPDSSGILPLPGLSNLKLLNTLSRC